jgi:hypothetical protein
VGAKNIKVCKTNEAMEKYGCEIKAWGYKVLSYIQEECRIC